MDTILLSVALATMDARRLPLIIATLYFTSLVHTKTLTEILSHYDTVNKNHFKHNIVRRGVASTLYDRDIDFHSNNKHFHVKLVSSRDMFPASLRAVSVDGFGKEDPVHIDMATYYKGYVADDASSHVLAHVEDDGMITATIDTANETYIIEPMWRHVVGLPSHDMIIYKASDFRWNTTNSKHGGESSRSFCGNTYSNTKSNNREGIHNGNPNGKARGRRSIGCKDVTSSNTCNLMLVGDHHFFQHMGRRNKGNAIYYMLHTLLRVDRIFRGTCWEGVGRNVGVQVEDVKIYTQPTVEGSATHSFNKHKTHGWQVEELLEAFSREDWSEYCLAHLFTYQTFDEGVIGLAYISKERKTYGGICSPRYQDETPKISQNCALTTYLNWGRPLTTLESDIVTAHEIGHNFGSNHDPDDEKCSPEEGGKYIMYASAVSGTRNNHKVFSDCSRNEIGGVLREKMETCFKHRNSTVCGNSIVDAGEECDDGLHNTNHKCCDKNCRLQAGANCSDHNHLCCVNCTIASTNTICAENSTLECKGEIKCDGVSSDCPKTAPRLSSEKCISHFSTGICKDGECKSYCPANSTPCACAELENACNVCCKKNGSAGLCEPVVFAGERVQEINGSLCKVSAKEGSCLDGRCSTEKKQVRDEPNFADLFRDFSFDSALLLMRNNFVLFILFFSLLLWLPGSLIVNYLDQKEDDVLMQRELSRHLSRNEHLKARLFSAGVADQRNY